MKKFYSALALAAAVTLSATAADVNRRVSIQKVATLDPQLVEHQAEKPAKAQQKASTQAPTNIEELQGIYTVSLYCPFEGYGSVTREFAILPGSDADHIKIIGLATIPIEAQVNYSGAIITVPGRTALPPERINVGGTTSEYDLFLSHMHWYPTGDGKRALEPMYEDGVVWVMLEDGQIVYDDKDDCLMLEVGNPSVGYLPAYSGCEFELTKQIEPTGEDWVRVGDASFIDDGFYMPNWTFNKEGDPEITCELQRDNNNPSHLRLYNAYGNINKDVSEWLGITNPAEYEIFNEENLPGSIQLNAEFPYCVAVPAAYLGIVSDGSLWYGTNMEAGSLDGATDREEQAQTLLNALGADKLSMIDYESKMAVLRNCEFKAAFVTGYTSWSTWASEHDIKDFDCSDTVTILLPENITEPSALGTITADENAPVEYFNLQGIRIDNPESGLYIRRQGNTVTKVIK